jgi:hypothetical protein
LEAAFEQAADGALHAFEGRRDTSANLRTRLMKIIRRAGLTPWPKLFHNLRASRATELVETYPLHVVCTRIGNTERIAAKHYLQGHRRLLREGDPGRRRKKRRTRGAKSGAASIRT